MMATSCNYSLNDNEKALVGNIFTAIQKAKVMYKYLIEEFNSIKAITVEVLKHSSEMKLFAFWASDFEEPGAETVINIKDFSIDDLAFLPYGKLLSITK